MVVSDLYKPRWGDSNRLPLPQGILGVFLREPLMDWQREGRAVRRASGGSRNAAADGEDADDAYTALKVVPAFRRGNAPGHTASSGLQRLCPADVCCDSAHLMLPRGTSRAGSQACC